MECIVVMLVAVLLLWFDVISASTYVLICLGACAWSILAAGLYLWFGLFKFWYHDFLGWHKPDVMGPWFDGCSFHAKCKYCGKEIIHDSQGNWFTFEE